MRYLIFLLIHFFIRHHRKFNKEWDKKLNQILDEFNIVEFNEYIVSLKHKRNIYDVWIANYPYDSFTLYSKNGFTIDNKLRFRPSIKTQFRFYNLVLKNVLRKRKKREQNLIKKTYEE